LVYHWKILVLFVAVLEKKDRWERSL